MSNSKLSPGSVNIFSICQIVLFLFFSGISKYQIYMFVMEHLSREDIIYLYSRNLNREVHLHITILKLG